MNIDIRDTTSIADRLRDFARGTKEWRVQNVMDGCYMMFFKHWQETEARQWFEDQQRRYPDSVRGYELALVDVKSERDALCNEAADELDRLRARVAEWEQKAANWIASPEATARLDGYRELAQRLNAADARVAELERDRVHAGVDICEVAAAVEVVRVMEIVKEVAGVVANLHEGPFRHGFEAACEEIEHRLRPCEHCDTALAKDGA